jgi:hypothetical protein
MEAAAPSPTNLEPTMQVHQILFLVWIIVFVFWAARQISAANRRHDERQQQQD